MEKVIQYRTIDEAKAMFEALPPSSRETIDAVDSALAFVRIANVSRLGKLKRLYEGVDAVVAEVSPHSVCQKGCSACCHIDVHVRLVEAEFIERNTGRRANRGTSHSDGHGAAKRPCPFLEADQSCAIYAFRPLACRQYMAFDDPQFCADLKVAHVVYREDSHPGLLKLAVEIERLNGRGGRRDVRDFFGQA